MVQCYLQQMCQKEGFRILTTNADWVQQKSILGQSELLLMTNLKHIFFKNVIKLNMLQRNNR